MGLLPPIISVLEGNITGFTSSMDQAKGKLDEVDRLSAGVSKRQVQATSMGLMAVGGLATGAGGFLVGMSDKVEKSQAALQQVIENTGGKWSDYSGQVQAAIEKEVHYAHGSSDTQDALAKLTAAYQDPKKALQELSLTTDIAAFKHIDLADAAAIVVRLHAGAAKTFKEFGINTTDMTKEVKAAETADKAHATAVVGLEKAQQSLSDLEARDAGKKKLTIADTQALAKAHDAVAAAQGKVIVTANASVAAHAAAAGATANHEKQMAMLEQRLHGVAAAQADTFGGKLDEIKTRVENFAASIGRGLGPVLIGLGPVLMGIGGAMQVFTVMTWAGVASVWAFLWPILAVIAALVVITAGVIYAYTHFDWFRNTVNFLWKEIQVLWGWRMHPTIRHGHAAKTWVSGVRERRASQ